jgi:hypothetical protein
MLIFTSSGTVAFHVCAALDLPSRAFYSDKREVTDTAKKVYVSVLALSFFGWSSE